MKSFKADLFLVTMLLAALVTTLSKGEIVAVEAEAEEPTSTSFHGPLRTSRFLGRQVSGAMSCQKNPRVCYAKGSPGPDCCKNNCVNLLRDALNCGRCGKKCSYKKICCEGKCVNPLSNEQHCGKCGNKCDSRTSCLYGMCSYA